MLKPTEQSRRDTHIDKKLYDKRDDFNFPIVNFPFICRNIPAVPAYGVFGRLPLTRKLLNQGFILVKLKLSLRKFYSRYHDLIIPYGICVTNDHGYAPLVISTSWSFPHSRLVTWFVARVTLRMPPVEQELLTIPEYLRSLPGFSVVRVARFSVFCLVFCRYIFRCLSFFVWPLCCLSFDLRILITLLVYSNSS